VQPRVSGDPFLIDLNDVRLPDDEKVKLSGAIQGAALATFDARGDHIAIAFPRDGGTQGRNGR
jgi:hypothetical protein